MALQRKPRKEPIHHQARIAHERGDLVFQYVDHTNDKPEETTRELDLICRNGWVISNVSITSDTISKGLKPNTYTTLYVFKRAEHS